MNLICGEVPSQFYQEERSKFSQSIDAYDDIIESL